MVLVKNREPMLQVMEMHRDAVKRIHPSVVDTSNGGATLRATRRTSWAGCFDSVPQLQVTDARPDGYGIAFMADIVTRRASKPDIALVKHCQKAGRPEAVC